jgi:hypothetical protein
MREHVLVDEFAARMGLQPVDMDTLIFDEGLRVVESGGRRYLRLADAGRIVQAIDKPAGPRSEPYPRGWIRGGARPVR